MKAYVIAQAGGTDVLQLQDIPDPAVRDGEVRIRVRAFGINRLEVDVRAGAYGPVTAQTVLGIEAVGEVIEDPSGVFSPGQKVATAMGGLGEPTAPAAMPSKSPSGAKTSLRWAKPRCRGKNWQRFPKPS